MQLQLLLGGWAGRLQPGRRDSVASSHGIETLNTTTMAGVPGPLRVQQRKLLQRVCVTLKCSRWC
jgi:hypothetical protein